MVLGISLSQEGVRKARRGDERVGFGGFAEVFSSFLADSEGEAVILSLVDGEDGSLVYGGELGFEVVLSDIAKTERGLCC